MNRTSPSPLVIFPFVIPASVRKQRGQSRNDKVLACLPRSVPSMRVVGRAGVEDWQDG
jgi:hypothetical protein